MEDSRTKLCPFKRMPDGGLGLCSGEACMAYFEYKSNFTQFGETAAPDAVGLCRMMLQTPQYCV